MLRIRLENRYKTQLITLTYQRLTVTDLEPIRSIVESPFMRRECFRLAPHTLGEARANGVGRLDIPDWERLSKDLRRDVSRQSAALLHLTLVLCPPLTSQRRFSTFCTLNSTKERPFDLYFRERLATSICSPHRRPRSIHNSSSIPLYRLK